MNAVGGNVAQRCTRGRSSMLPGFSQTAGCRRTTAHLEAMKGEAAHNLCTLLQPAAQVAAMWWHGFSTFAVAAVKVNLQQQAPES